MKIILTFLLSTVTFLSINAQNAISLTPDTLFIQGDLSDDELKADFQVINNTSTQKTIVWERTIVSISKDWWTQVCDPITCWAPAKATSEFNLSGNNRADVYVGVFTEQLEGSAYIKMKVYDKANPSAFVVGRYGMSNYIVGTKEIEANNLKLYPNPTADYFVLEGVADVKEVQVLSVDGQLLKSFAYFQNEIYEIQDLPKGAYFLSLNGANGTKLATKKLIKL